ncbi:MAG: peptidase M20 [Gammaproteobacteria bacterium]|nr:MAG: peptidase M20 [Gammaproteobacteria bacterium]
MKEKIRQNGELHELMKTWRHTLHRHPETAFEEVKTADTIAELLRGFSGLSVHTGLAKTGIVAVLTGNQGDNGRMIGLRADIDALDISEEGEAAYRSTIAGKMHACGHDGHTTMLLGAAKYLSEHPDFAGKIAFIFQPAEENAGGGDVMCKEGLFEQFPCEAVFGMHNWPGLPAGHFAVHEREVMASTDSFDVMIEGSGAHAAMPNLGIDPMVVAAQLINAFQTIVSRSVAPTDTAVVSVTKMDAGSAYNIIPSRVTFCGTIRSFSHSVRDTIQTLMAQQVDLICRAFGATGSIRFHDAYPATINHPEQARICADVLKNMVGEQRLHLDMPPSMGAEDFSYMLMEKPGAYIWLGNGEDSYSLHHAKYDFNDDILPVGASYWVALSYHYLQSPI